MNILSNKELYQYPYDEIELITMYKKSDLLNEDQKQNLTNDLKDLHHIHHNELYFRHNFDQLFSRLEKGIFDKEEKMTIQGLHRGMGYNLHAIPLSIKLHFFLIEGESGLNILVNPNEINEITLFQILDTIQWLKYALKNPEDGMKQMASIQLKNQLDTKLAINQDNENKIKL